MRDELLFHLTGRRTDALAPIDGRGLRPALFARFGDLVRLRYDYPLVLLDGDGAAARPLSDVIDELLRDVAPRGPAGEGRRRAVLRLERAIRGLLAEGAEGTLASLWDVAAERLRTTGGEPVASELAAVRAALRVEGVVLDCEAGTAARFVTHVWRRARERRRAAMRRTIEALVLRLGGLVRADLLRSEAGRRPELLAAGVGSAHRELFDFDVMARVLARPSGTSALSDARRRRIDETLGALRAERFFTTDRAFDYEFDRLDDAIVSYRERTPAAAELLRAIAVAELEVEGLYDEATHDAYFRGFDERALSAEDLATFPAPLVRVDARAADARPRAELFEALSAGAPLKIVLETDDLFGPGAQLATTAMAQGDVFVVQTPSSYLYRVAADVSRAIDFQGPALICVFDGALPGARVPPYLVAAAAREARAFPAFTYDPSAGAELAERFSLRDDVAGDPPSEQEIAYANESETRVCERAPFTLADVALCDPHNADHFAIVPRERWTDLGTEVPSVYAIDGEDRLLRLAVDARLDQAARRAAEAWRRLRELERLKTRDIARLDAGRPAVATETDTSSRPATTPGGATAAGATTPGEGAAAGAVSAQEAARETEPRRGADDPWIETPRCSSCNECTLINSRMFAYNENKQAYIKDPTAGTFRELVEAAESCQVAIIHPGKPRDPNEPGLEELLQRAAAFP